MDHARYAVIDVGSNTIHLLVGEVNGGSVLPVTGEKFSALLGRGVDKTGKLEDARVPLAAQAIELFTMAASLHGAPEPVVLATSAVRDARNGTDLVNEVRERTGLKMHLVSGKEEATLGFRGAVSALGPDYSWDAPALVVDLGGGSAQLILGDADSGPEKRVSLPLGTNRTTERFVDHDPPLPGELDRLRKTVPGMLGEWELAAGTALVAIGGSARAMLRLTRDELTRPRLQRLAEEVSDRPSAVLARETGLTPERARVMPAAVATLETMLRHFEKTSLTVARGGIREGVILTLAERDRNGEEPNGGM